MTKPLDRITSEQVRKWARSRVLAGPRTKFNDIAAQMESDEARIVELEAASRAILTAVRGDEHGEFWTVRALLNKRGVYHDNLQGLRVVEELLRSLLARSAAPGEEKA
jgi:hypothetical protein